MKEVRGWWVCRCYYLQIVLQVGGRGKSVKPSVFDVGSAKGVIAKYWSNNKVLSLKLYILES